MADTQAAATYGADLDAWSAELSAALEKPKALATVLGESPGLAPATAEEPPPEYDVAAGIADRVDGIVAELREYADDGKAGLLYYDVYDAYFDYHTANFDLLADATDAAIDRLGNPHAADFATRQQIQSLDKDLRLLRAYDDRLAQLEDKSRNDALVVSSLEYQRSEVAWLADFQREYQRYVRIVGAYASADAYSDRYINEETYFAQATLTAIEAKEPMLRRLETYVDELATLAGQELTELPADAPTVGDVYRWRLSETVAPTGRSDEKSRHALTDQLWLLYRLKELEDTPDELYDAAREMLLLQVTADPRSPFEDILATAVALHSTFPGSTDPRTKDILDEVERTLAPETVAVLEPYQTQLRALVTRFRPAQRDVFAGELWDFTLRKYDKVAGQAARAVDAHKALAEQIRAGIAATRSDA